MKELQIFFLPGCPYCDKARKAIGELKGENAVYDSIPLRWINEQAETSLAESMDYYYVPTFFYAGEKLYECSPRHDYEDIKTNIRTVFETALCRAEK